MKQQPLKDWRGKPWYQGSVANRSRGHVPLPTPRAEEARSRTAQSALKRLAGAGFAIWVLSLSGGALGATSKPAAPTNLAGTPVASGCIQVTWNDNSSDETQFYLDRTVNNFGSTVQIVLVANATSYLDTNLLAGTTYSYRVRAYNSAGYSAYSNTNSATTWSPPAVTQPPQNQTVTAGSNAAFTVTASGTAPLHYQWQFNRTAIPGATATSLALVSVQSSNAGNYAVVVSNAVASVTSAVAVLTVLVPPAITAQPQNCTNVAGTTATFAAAASGSPPLGYQWQFNSASLTSGPRITGANTNSLSISGLVAADAGDYSLIVSNAIGAVTSAPAVLTVVVPPVIVVQPAGLSMLAGSAADMSVTASGSVPLSYQWMRDGTNLTDGANISGTTSALLHLANLQTNQTANYRAVVTNGAGAVTSTIAQLTVTLVPVAPSILSQPAAQVVTAGSNVSFTVSVVGTSPLTFQWRCNGTNLSDGGQFIGASSPLLLVANAQPANAGGYSVVVSNIGGAVASSVAALAVNVPAVVPVDAVVLVNSRSARYLDFQHYLKPYLDNFGFPYSVLDLATNAVGPDISNHSVIVTGHSELATNQLYLNGDSQRNLSVAVSNGVGLVSFDNNLSIGTTPRYQFIQDIFAFGYGAGVLGGSVTFPATEPLAQMHYITALHQAGEVLGLRGDMNMAELSLPADATAPALSDGHPFVAVRKYGQGRAVQWNSYDWMATSVLGPIDGLDDLVWRSIVWAARKPFVMRGLPNLATLRMDDVSGPFWWAHVANEMGFKPWLSLFLNSIDETEAADLRNLVTNGLATTSIHSYDAGYFFYFDHNNGTDYPDNVISNNYFQATQWHTNHGIPISKVVGTHYSAMGRNAFAGLQAWGVEFFPIEITPGQVEYGTPPALWLVAGPYRYYETPGAGNAHLPFFYADFLTVLGHPEFDGKFFNCYTEIRDDSTCHEFCPDNDVAGTVGRGTRQLKRAFDSMVMGTLYTHEWYLIPIPGSSNQTPITTNNWRAALQGITNGLAAYHPNYVTLDYACQYVRATRTSCLVSGSYDPLSGMVSVTFSGKTDLPTQFSVFTGADRAISNSLATALAFLSGRTFSTLVTVIAPTLLNPPSSLICNAGGTATFLANASGTPPLSYRWFKNATNLLSDAGNVSGSATSLLTLTNVLGADAGQYTVVVSNLAGGVTSSPALLTVIDPIFTREPVSAIAALGLPGSFTVGIYGTAPQYQWRKDGATIAGATSSAYALEAVADADGGAYVVVVSNAFGVLTSTPPATLTVNDPPSITRQPASSTNDATTMANFTVMATGTGLSYRWFKNETNLLTDAGNLSGSATNVLTIANVMAADGGDYSVQVSGPAGMVTSLIATLTVIDPVIQVQPVGEASLVGSTVMFAAAAAGTPPLAYQWVKNEVDIQGATEAALSLANVSDADAASYSVRVRNSAGAATSDSATLLIIARPTLQIVGNSTAPGCLTVSVAGSDGFRYGFQATTNFVDWTNLATNAAPYLFTDPDATGLSARFYRAFYVP